MGDDANRDRKVQLDPATNAYIRRIQRDLAKVQPAVLIDTDRVYKIQADAMKHVAAQTVIQMPDLQNLIPKSIQLQINDIGQTRAFSQMVEQLSVNQLALQGVLDAQQAVLSMPNVQRTIDKVLAQMQPTLAARASALFESEMARVVDSARALGSLSNITERLTTLPKFPNREFTDMVTRLTPPQEFLDRAWETLDADVGEDQLDELSAAIDANPFWRSVIDVIVDSGPYKKTFNRKTARAAVWLWILAIAGTLHIAVGAIPFAGGIPGALGVPGAKDLADKGAKVFDRKFPPQGEEIDDEDEGGE